MAALRSLGVGLAIVFAVFLVLSLGQIYYLRCWKRRALANSRVTSMGHDPWGFDVEMVTHNDLPVDTVYLHPCGDCDRAPLYSEVIEMLFSLPGSGPGELDGDGMQLRSLLGPPRILFTIKEETKEDLECADVEMKWSRDWHHLKDTVDESKELVGEPSTPLVTPYCTPDETPSTTPPFVTPSFTPPSSPPSTLPITSPQSPAPALIQHPPASSSVPPHASLLAARPAHYSASPVARPDSPRPCRTALRDPADMSHTPNPSPPRFIVFTPPPTSFFDLIGSTDHDL